MSLQKSGYKKRIIDTKIEEYLQLFGAILIEDPKWYGKTWTSLNHANSVTYIMDPAGNYSNRTIDETSLKFTNSVSSIWKC